MSKDLEIAAIQRDVNAAYADRALANALSRLEGHSDFQLLIKQAYFQNEAVRLVHLRSEPDAVIESIDKQMDAIAGLSGFFRQIRQKGEMAEKSIRDGESTIEQLHTED